MKRVIRWVVEERITLLIFLLVVGIVLGSLSHWSVLGGMMMYGVLILAVLSLGHSLYLHLKKK